MDNDAKLRPLYLAKVLYEQTDEAHFLTTTQLIQILEEEHGIKSHRQTIKAEIELLKQFGLDIKEIKSTQNKYYLIGRHFDVSEVKLLIDSVKSSKFIAAGKNKELVDKIGALTSGHLASSLKRNIKCEGCIKTENENIDSVIDAINEAININKKISFQYFQYNVRKEKKIKRNREPYIITPLHLVWNGECYYMVGVCDYQRRLDCFRIDRIFGNPTILDETGDLPPEDFDIDAYINIAFRMFNSEHEEVELICDNDVMDSIVDRFGEDVTTYANDMTSFRAIVDVAVSHVFFSWIFGLGGKVKIKGPENVRAKYAKMLRDAVVEFAEIGS